MVELVVGHVGRHLSTGNFIFGKESYTVNLFGMFLRPGGRAFVDGTQKSGLPN